MSPPALPAEASREPLRGPEPGGGVFYGWRIVGLTFVAQFLAMGTFFYTFGVFLKPLTEALGTERFYVSLALSLQQIVVALLGPWVGKRIAEHSIRGLMLWGTALLTTGGLLFSQAQTIWHLYVAYSVILGAGVSLAGPLPNTALLANWFVRKRGAALGISQFGVTISGSIMVPFATWLVATYDWRTAMVALAILPIVLLSPAIAAVVVDRPEDRGLHPDGALHPVHGDDSDEEKGWTLLAAVRDRRVQLLALTVGLNFAAMSAILQVLHSHFTDAGMTGAAAAGIVAVVTFAGAIAKPLFGLLADRFGPRPIMGMSIGLQASGVAVMLLASDAAASFAGGAIFGLGYGGVLPLWGLLVGVLFGRSSFGRVLGLMAPIMLPFQMLGFPFATWVFDHYGSYRPAFFAFLGSYALAGAFLAMLPARSAATASSAG